MHDIFDGFEAHADPDLENPLTREDFEEGRVIVVFDTNSWLALYKTDDEVRKDLFRVYREVSANIFAPHESIREFWKNRDTIILDTYKIFDKAIGEIKGGAGKMRTGLRNWAGETGRDWSTDGRGAAEEENERPNPTREEFDGFLERIKELEEDLKEFFDKRRKETITFGTYGDDLLEMKRPGDPVLKSIAELLEGKVGPAPTAKDREKRYKEYQERVKKELPPGLTDADKTKESDIGDYLIWMQMLDHAKQVKARGGDDADSTPHMLLVTKERKLDWWRNAKINGGSKPPHVGAHRHLLQEYRDIVGEDGIFFVRGQADFVRLIKDQFDLAISERTLTAVQSSMTDSDDEEGAVTLYVEDDDITYSIGYNRDTEEIWVVEGDFMALEVQPYLARKNPAIVAARDELIEDGTVMLHEDGDCYVFQEEHYFESLTQALNMVAGQWGTGRRKWLTEDGIPVSEL